MRAIQFVIATMLSVAVVPANAVPHQCSVWLKLPALTAPGKDARAAVAACLPPNAHLQARADVGVQRAQYAPGSCSVPGQTTCVNGWVAVCQCFSYGCNYMATANRC